MAQAASLLETSGDHEGATQIQNRMREELMAMPLEEAFPLVVSFWRVLARLVASVCEQAFSFTLCLCLQRAFGHYLNLSSIAELVHRWESAGIHGSPDHMESNLHSY
jgi:hypothetical protein